MSVCLNLLALPQNTGGLVPVNNNNNSFDYMYNGRFMFFYCFYSLFVSGNAVVSLPYFILEWLLLLLLLLLLFLLIVFSSHIHLFRLLSKSRSNDCIINAQCSAFFHFLSEPMIDSKKIIRILYFLHIFLTMASMISSEGIFSTNFVQINITFVLLTCIWHSTWLTGWWLAFFFSLPILKYTYKY